MRVALDLTCLLGPRTGVATVAHHIAAGLGRRPEVTVAGFATSGRDPRALVGQVPPGVRAVRRPLPARILDPRWAAGRGPALDRLVPTDLVHGLNFTVPPTRQAARVLTVHDLTPLTRPDLCDDHTRTFPARIRLAVASGATVHAVSTHVGEALVADLGVPVDQVVVIPNGVDPVTGGRPGAGRALTGGHPYILALGTIEPRKDLPTLVTAFAHLADTHPDHHLVLAGPDGWGLPALTTALDTLTPTHRTRVHRLGWIDDTTRADLLTDADVFAYPSLDEGFGLPPLEAMTAGTPVVTTTAGALPETCGPAATLVPPRDPDALAAAITHILDDPTHATTLTTAGHTHAATYTWDRTTTNLLDLYRTAVDAGS